MLRSWGKRMMKIFSGVGKAQTPIVTICMRLGAMLMQRVQFTHIFRNTQAYLTFLYIQRSRATRSDP